jgi:vitamin B12 transporter
LLIKGIKRILLGLALASCTSLYSQDTAAVKGKSLDEISVVQEIGKRVIVTDISHSSPRYLLSIQQLEKLGVNDIGESLKYLPGVQIRDYGGIGGVKTISYRSLSGNYTSLQYDHTTCVDAQTGVLNLTSFQLLGIRSLEFTSGQPAAWQSTPLNYLSVNNIALQSEIFHHSDSLKAEVFQRASTIHAFQSGGFVSLPIGGWHIGSQIMMRYGSGEYDFIYPESGSNATMTRTNSNLMGVDGKIVLGYEKGKSQVNLSGSIFYNEQQLPGAVILYNPSNDQQLLNRNHKLNVQYAFNGNKWKINSYLNYQSLYTHYHDPHYLNFNGFISSEYTQEQYTGGFMINRFLGNTSDKIFAGVDIIQANLESNTVPSSPSRTSMISTMGASKWFGRLKIEANLSTQLVADQTFESDAEIDRTFFKMSPYFAASVLPFKHNKFRIRSFYKHTYRVPTFNDLYYNFLGNTFLDPEEAHVVNLGLTHGVSASKHHFEFSLDAYYNQVKDKIVAIPTKDIFNWSMQNVGLTESRGIDINVGHQFSKGNFKWIATVSQNLNHTVDITDESSLAYGHQLPYTPKLTTSVSLMPSWKGYGLNINGIYSGKRYALSENIPSNLLESFIDFNIGFEKTFEMGRSAFWCSAQVMNVLGKNYEVVRSFPMPGRFYQLSLKFKYR